MAGVDQVDLDQAFERLVGLTRRFGYNVPDGWRLVPGRASTVDRTPWVIQTPDNRTVMTLGYTRREALTSLLSMCSILAVILGA